MSEHKINHTFDAGVNTSKKQKTKRIQKKNLKNKLSDIKKNKLAERILNDWGKDGKVHDENLNFGTRGILPIANEVVPKNKLSKVKNTMDEQTMPCTSSTGVKKTKKNPKEDLKKTLSGIKKNKLVEELLKDWGNDD